MIWHVLAGAAVGAAGGSAAGPIGSMLGAVIGGGLGALAGSEGGPPARACPPGMRLGIPPGGAAPCPQDRPCPDPRVCVSETTGTTCPPGTHRWTCPPEQICTMELKPCVPDDVNAGTVRSCPPGMHPEPTSRMIGAPEVCVPDDAGAGWGPGCPTGFYSSGMDGECLPPPKKKPCPPGQHQVGLATCAPDEPAPLSGLQIVRRSRR